MRPRRPTVEPGAYTQAKTAEYRELYPAPEQVVDRARWSDEDKARSSLSAGPS